MENPHLHNPIVFRGSGNEEADGVVVLLHGRRQRVDDIYQCAERVNMPRIRYVMPIADQATWYPRGFMRPVKDNEPRFSYALAAIDETVRQLIACGFSRNRVVLMGFSQGGCLACEYIYRNTDRWGGLIVFTGGLFGPENTIWMTTGSFRETPVFLGTGDPDEWIPVARVKETAHAFRMAGADVREGVYPNIGHSVCDEEILEARNILSILTNVGSEMGQQEVVTSS